MDGWLGMSSPSNSCQCTSIRLKVIPEILWFVNYCLRGFSIYPEMAFSLLNPELSELQPLCFTSCHRKAFHTMTYSIEESYEPMP